MFNDLVEHCLFGMLMEVYSAEISFGVYEMNKAICSSHY